MNTIGRPVTPTQLSPEAAISKLESAFEPLRCEARLADYNREIRFSIVDSMSNILLQQRILLRHACEEQSINAVIVQIKRQLANRKSGSENEAPQTSADD